MKPQGNRSTPLHAIYYNDPPGENISLSSSLVKLEGQTAILSMLS